MSQWRVNEHGIFRGTLRIAKFDFDTDPCEDYRQSVYKEMARLLNSEACNECQECQGRNEAEYFVYCWFDDIEQAPITCKRRDLESS